MDRNWIWSRDFVSGGIFDCWIGLVDIVGVLLTLVLLRKSSYYLLQYLISYRIY